MKCCFFFSFCLYLIQPCVVWEHEDCGGRVCCWGILWHVHHAVLWAVNTTECSAAQCASLTLLPDCKAFAWPQVSTSISCRQTQPNTHPSWFGLHHTALHVAALLIKWPQRKNPDGFQQAEMCLNVKRSTVQAWSPLPLQPDCHDVLQCLSVFSYYVRF